MGERFTEFYLLNSQNETISYPEKIILGEERKVIVGIINREGEVLSYRVEVNIDGVKNNEVGPVVLAHEQKWEGSLSFRPLKAGKHQKLSSNQ